MSSIDAQPRLNLLTYNCRGLKNKLKILKQILIKFKIHIVFLQEHFYKKNELINIKNYFTVQINRNNGHGGSAILIRSDLLKKESGFLWCVIPKQHYEFLEIVSIKAFYVPNKKYYLFSSVYLPPTRANYEANVKDLDNYVLNYYEKYKINLFGDFNHDLREMVNRKTYTNKLQEWYDNRGLFTVHTRTATRPISKTLLDYAITDNGKLRNPKVIKYNYKKDDSKSDHLPVIFELVLKKPKAEYVTPFRFPDFENINYEKLNEKIVYFEKFKLKDYFNKNITNEEFNTQIKDIIKLIVDETPIKKVCLNSKTWWNDKVKRKHKEYKKWKRKFKKMKKRLNLDQTLL